MRDPIVLGPYLGAPNWLVPLADGKFHMAPLNAISCSADLLQTGSDIFFHMNLRRIAIFCQMSAKPKNRILVIEVPPACIERRCLQAVSYPNLGSTGASRQMKIPQAAGIQGPPTQRLKRGSFLGRISQSPCQTAKELHFSLRAISKSNLSRL